MSELIKKIEEISIAFVMADMSDLQTFADIYKKFNDFSDIAKNESQDALVKVVSALSKLIERIILNEVTDKDSAIDAISQTIGIIQSIVVNQSKLSEVKFPDEIGISLSEIVNNNSNTAKSNENLTSIEKADDVNEINQSEQGSSNLNLGTSLFGDASLIADFIGESREHLHEADVQLLVLENDPNNEDALNAVYRAFHTIKGVAGFLNLNEISTLAHATEDLLDRARKGEITFVGAPIDVTFSSVDSLKQMIDDVEKALSSGNLTYSVKLNELIDSIKKAVSKEEKITDKVEIKDIQENNTSKENIEIKNEQILENKTVLINDVKEKEPAQDIKNVIPAFEKEDVQEKQVVKTSSYNIVKETLKIEAERLDKLVDMIGELVIAESMVTQDFEIISRASARVARNLTHLNKITRELQEIGMSLRMMPVKPVFERMARLARDLAKKSGKKIEFSMSGEDTEIDKSVVEKISDPLTHMIRNAVDHGIESDINDRIKLGKSEVGHIKISAFHKSGDIIIQVEDDGKGLDKDAILEKAKEKGIIVEGQAMSEQEIYNLIFMPGFSTAKIVTDVSGRGVGMDVVNRNIQSLRGQIDIHSARGKGTIFTLRLPLTLAIMDGIIVQVGTEQYIIPTLSVVESIRPKYEEISTIMGNAEMLSVRGKLLPMFRVSSLFQVNDAIQDPTEALIVIVEDEGKQVGFMVDNLVGHQQIVIKSLGDSFNNIKGISGGAIMADGRVGLILDVSGIVKLAVLGAVDEMAA